MRIKSYMTDSYSFQGDPVSSISKLMPYIFLEQGEV